MLESARSKTRLAIASGLPMPRATAGRGPAPAPGPDGGRRPGRPRTGAAPPDCRRVTVPTGDRSPATTPSRPCARPAPRPLPRRPPGRRPRPPRQPPPPGGLHRRGLPQSGKVAQIHPVPAQRRQREVGEPAQRRSAPGEEPGRATQHPGPLVRLGKVHQRHVTGKDPPAPAHQRQRDERFARTMSAEQHHDPAVGRKPQRHRVQTQRAAGQMQQMQMGVEQPPSIPHRHTARQKCCARADPWPNSAGQDTGQVRDYLIPPGAQRRIRLHPQTPPGAHHLVRAPPQPTHRPRPVPGMTS